LTETENKYRIRIAGAFEKHFRQYGFKKTTVDEVAAEMGVSKKTIYRHFRSKEDIFRYLIRNIADDRVLMITRKIESQPKAWEKLESTIQINFAEFRKIQKRKARMPDNLLQSEMASGIFRKAFYGLLKDIVDEGVSTGEFEVCNPETTVKYIQAMISESLFWIVEDISARPEDSLFCAIKKLLQKQNKPLNRN